jgi:transposase
MNPSLLLPDRDLLRLDRVLLSAETITLVVSTLQPLASCPRCGQPASRVHSAYVRSPADLPCCGTPLRLEIHARRFHCDQPDCSCRIFTERLPGVVAPYSRRTTRLADTFDALAYALGGEAGARLAATLGMGISPDALLQLLSARPAPTEVTPRVLGVDDWAMRKRHTYGTILVDLERACVIDLLPDRRAESLANWLREHPGVEIIARDRGGPYAEGARQGAPDAVQVADRWHLLKNLAEALEAMLAREQRALTAAAVAPVPSETEVAGGATATPAPAATGSLPAPASTSLEPTTRAQRDSQRRRERRQAVFTEVRRLYDEGYRIRTIAEKLGKSRHTVRKYVLADAFPEPKKRQWGPGQLAPYRAYLEERWRQGCHNATQLWREIRDRGYGGACSAVRRLVSEWRSKLPPEERRTSGKAPGRRGDPRAPAPRAVVWWLLGEPETLEEEEAAFVERLKQACPQVERAQSLAREFFGMARRREGGRLKGWIERVASSGIEELERFATGLLRDWEAVVAGMTLEWSSGPVEGQVNRLKLVKRQMFGRAGFGYCDGGCCRGRKRRKEEWKEPG